MHRPHTPTLAATRRIDVSMSVPSAAAKCFTKYPAAMGAKDDTLMDW